MYCHACGIALTQPTTKYCNRCGVQLAPTESALKDQALDKRLESHLDSVFWVSVFGLGFVVGGVVLLKNMGFSDVVMLTYAVLSSTVFLINLVLNVWRSVSLLRGMKERNVTIQQAAPATAELNPARPDVFLTPAHSVTENTTRSFEPVQRVNRSDSE